MEGLSKLKELKILNLANNTIFTISGLAECTALQSLTLTHNYLADFMSIEHLGQCSNTLTSIDLAENKIGAD
jgi:Leucine-rich repeat (LRR) protein